MYDLIVFKRQLNKWKVLIASVATIILVFIMTADGILLAKKVQAGRYTKQILAQAEQIENEELDVLVVKKPQVVIKNPTWENMQEFREIYTAKEEKEVYLTFDDGPSKAITIPLLDLLAQEGIKVTFFALGKNVERYPEITKRAYEEGHYIANHGYSHQYSAIYTSFDTILEEFNHTEDAIRSAIGKSDYHSHLFRFPGGSIGGKYKVIKSNAKSVLEENEIFYLDWNALTKDAEGAKTSEAQLAGLEETVGDKSSVVVLMHDAADKTVTLETMPQIIAFFRDRGYTFKNIYDLIK